VHIQVASTSLHFKLSVLTPTDAKARLSLSGMPKVTSMLQAGPGIQQHLCQALLALQAAVGSEPLLPAVQHKVHQRLTPSHSNAYNGSLPGFNLLEPAHVRLWLHNTCHPPVSQSSTDRLLLPSVGCSVHRGGHRGGPLNSRAHDIAIAPGGQSSTSDVLMCSKASRPAVPVQEQCSLLTVHVWLQVRRGRGAAAGGASCSHYHLCQGRGDSGSAGSGCSRSV